MDSDGGAGDLTQRVAGLVETIEHARQFGGCSRPLIVDTDGGPGTTLSGILDTLLPSRK